MRHAEKLEATRFLRAVVCAFLAVLTAAPILADDEGGYGFYRTIEGDVRLTTLDRAEPLDVEPDYPLLLGDRIWVAPGGRLEAILPDLTILRAGGGTDLYFEELALYAGEPAGVGSVLRLLEGEIQVVVTEFQTESLPIRIEAPNATIYLQEPGTYRIYADDRQWTELVVREGFGEVALAEGSIVVRSNEEAVVDGEYDPRVRVYPAGALDALEAWGAELDREAQLAARDPYVDESLRYPAAPLREHGEWLSVSAGYAWRPYVSVGWRPYTRGYWTYTPAGRYWVSAEPWALTFHYGSWTLDPYYGWVWYPGSVFSPAWVTWYWGPSYVGWVPSGYYGHFYGPYGYGPRLAFGFYGWAGGSWSYYSHWTFCPTRYFGWRSYGSYWRSGSELGRSVREIERGLILGSTAHIPRNFIGRPEEIAELEAVRREREARSGRKLGDVTEFVARRPGLSTEVREAVFTRPGERRSLIDRGPERSMARIDTPVGSTVRRGPSDELSRETRPLPSRPDLSRSDIATRSPVRREPIERESSPGFSDRRVPIGQGPSGRIEEPARELRPSSPRAVESPGLRSLPGATTREPTRFEDREPTRFESREPMRTMPPSAATPRVTGPSEVPVVRRVLDGIRGSQPMAPRPPQSAAPSPPSSSPRVSTPAAPQRPTASPQPSRPSSPPSSVRRPSSPPPKISKPSSGSSMRSSSQSISRKSTSSSSKSDRSSGSTRSQSRPKSKPPGR